MQTQQADSSHFNEKFSLFNEVLYVNSIEGKSKLRLRAAQLQLLIIKICADTKKQHLKVFWQKKYLSIVYKVFDMDVFRQKLKLCQLGQKIGSILVTHNA